uniref:Receptor-like serine/threonine-protein kinase n=1 Tax=Daucus carota subsp. sativus TaxID=79200 RepID=A0A166GYM4_DAUCS|nr:PREDICTED: G-type lectin S-receptor-like serine/threonine-protein kinase At2g19130 [Daucus carota subsp. sativus]
MDARKTPFFVPILFYLCFFINLQFSFGADSISAYQSLSGDETIVSSGGNFELGFFKPGNFSKYYIGIWFKKVSARTVIWVANRERPITDKYSSVLQVVDGNLVLFDETHTEIWSTNTKLKSSRAVAILLDEGNLVLRNGSSNSTVWQSRDYPSDTWLPGGYLGYDKRANRTQILTSWKNSEDPSPGLYTFELDPVGNQYLLRWNRSRQIWTSGVWNGRLFTNVPEMASGVIFSFTYRSNTNGSYLTYFLENTSSITQWRFIVDYNGQIKELGWLADQQKWSSFWSKPNTQCQVHAFCGAYGVCNDLTSTFCNCLPGFKSRFEKSWTSGDYSGGCKRLMELEYGNANTTSKKADIFQFFSHMKWPDNPQAFSAVNAARCKSNCLSNISCTAYAYYQNTCFTWHGDLYNMQQLPENDNNGRVIYIRIPSSDSSKNNKGIIFGVVGGSIAILSIFSGLLLLAFRRHKANKIERAAEGRMVAFGYKDLKNATKNFSEMLGKGGFGSVYKGTLPDSTVIAVKKLEGVSQGEKQFRNEISTIGNIQHINLVHLRGFCSQGNKKLLVYEYASNGSLDSHLFNPKKDEGILPWTTRYEIALGTARGLVYLHEKCRDCIIHCDIKPENILLDSYMCPKVADFGLAKLVGHNFSRVLTTMRGTRGYLAPEWISGAAITTKADVYSYGMMLLELVSGRRNSEETRDGKVNFFPAIAANVIMNEGDILTILDPNLNLVADIEEVSNICRLACWCIQEDEHVRPTMSKIVQVLEGVLDVDMPPDPRGLQVFIDNEDDIVFLTDKPSSSNLHIQSDPAWASSFVEEQYTNKKTQGSKIQECESD